MQQSRDYKRLRNRTLVGPVVRISRWTSYREVSRTRNRRVPHAVRSKRELELVNSVSYELDERRSGEAELGASGRAYRGTGVTRRSSWHPRRCSHTAVRGAYIRRGHAGSPSRAQECRHQAGRSHTGRAHTGAAALRFRKRAYTSRGRSARAHWNIQRKSLLSFLLLHLFSYGA